MVVDLLSSPINFVINELFTLVFGNARLIGLFFLILGFVMCLANGIELDLTLILLTPLTIGLIMQGYMPTVVWVFIILLSSMFWILFGREVGNVR